MYKDTKGIKFQNSKMGQILCAVFGTSSQIRSHTYAHVHNNYYSIAWWEIFALACIV